MHRAAANFVNSAACRATTIAGPQLCSSSVNCVTRRATTTTTIAAKPPDVLVIGAGIVGCAHALALTAAGARVTLVERNALPSDASVRNFGFITSLVGFTGLWGDRAARSRAAYKSLAAAGALHIHYAALGGMQVATTHRELAVLTEFAAAAPAAGYNVELMSPHAAATANPIVDAHKVLGALLFKDDFLIEPRSLFTTLIPWLCRERGVTYLPHTTIVGLVGEEGAAGVRATTAAGAVLTADRAFLCAGADVNTLFPSFFASPELGAKLVKLQMLRLRLPSPLTCALPVTSPQSMRRYPCFRVCPSHAGLDAEAADRDAAYDAKGIHVIARPAGDLSLDATFGNVVGGGAPARALRYDEVVVGDSHQVSPLVGDSHQVSPLVGGRGGAAFDDTLSEAVTADILRCAGAFLGGMQRANVVSQWAGVYMTVGGDARAWRCSTRHGGAALGLSPDRGRIHVVTGLGGGGMTMSLALAEDTVAALGL